ncbi:zinc-finger domain-containing protein [Paenibacillus jilunlii]|uniref:Uncharacterized protein n=1 Tax=Paenibacillus jilunlii TaxID=682956 RepID=A0A1H0A1Z3_9BACL|nr:zinc-finger domain-containing protein [Paenibacillus jilunlii]KWX79949.1 hypothetical protein AML91_01915 [Paenibacillus jilunlii]SDN27812.1 Protein of unknown function [Paenibacillus jilunlii]
MERKEALKEMDAYLKVCKTCTTRNDKKWANPSYNRLQKHCNTECNTGEKLLRIADVLKDEVRARRKQKGVSA